MAIILLIALFPAVFFAIIAGIFYHPWFFLILLVLLLGIPALMALRRED
jgi:hypothetical protein